MKKGYRCVLVCCREVSETLFGRKILSLSASVTSSSEMLGPVSVVPELMELVDMGAGQQRYIVVHLLHGVFLCCFGA